MTVKSNGKGKVASTAKGAVKTLQRHSLAGTPNGIADRHSARTDLSLGTYTGKGTQRLCEVTVSAAAGGGARARATSRAPAKDQQACLAAVSRQTNNGEVVVLDTNSSEANNTVIVGVGKDKAKWRCLVKNGRVADVMSLTDEGGL